MSEDIFKEWRHQRFVVTHGRVLGNSDPFEYIIVLSDIEYWHKNWETLGEWCKDNQSEVLGMTVNIPDEETLVMFILRWS
jgi:hypothetical protein